MPNRILKESICFSATVNDFSWFEECMFYRLIVNCDDFGRFYADPLILKAKLFPMKTRLTLREIKNALQSLATAGCVILYESEGKPFLQLSAWNRHQKPRAKTSKFPAPAGTCGQMYAAAPGNGNVNENENENGNGIGNESVRLYHSICPGLPPVLAVTPERAENIRRCGEAVQGDWKGLFQRVQRSDFLTGKVKSWKADFDWIISHQLQIREGRYDNSSGQDGRDKLHRSLLEELEQESVQRLQGGEDV